MLSPVARTECGVGVSCRVFLAAGWTEEGRPFVCAVEARRGRSSSVVVHYIVGSIRWLVELCHVEDHEYDPLHSGVPRSEEGHRQQGHRASQAGQGGAWAESDGIPKSCRAPARTSPVTTTTSKAKGTKGAGEAEALVCWHDVSGFLTARRTSEGQISRMKPAKSCDSGLPRRVPSKRPKVPDPKDKEGKVLRLATKLDQVSSSIFTLTYCSWAAALCRVVVMDSSASDVWAEERDWDRDWEE
ncbi:hypothetical protein CVT26_009966 [Gymnopilus dilepis]|uniref:Uncharacterized protein n=1 Tax=Gymnopilus dilepis TaxID=231916 RepID=A0A409VLB8_9AGAR|nr:hypothetical protein CVT26_009966 [Gymnopilus dilepis]